MDATPGSKTASCSPSETIPARFARQAARLGRKTLFSAKRDGRYQPLSWTEVQEQVTALAAYLLHERVEPGDRVLIFCENRPEWGISDLAIQSVGGWGVPIYPTLTEEGLRVICQDAQPVAAVVSSADQLARLRSATQGLACLRLIIVLQDGEQPNAQLVRWPNALARGREALDRVRPQLDQRLAALTPDDTATLIYTSGTTGEPKGVRLSHRNFLSNVDASLQVLSIREGDRHLSFLPLCHVFERMAGWYLMMTAGASVAFAENMDTIPQNMLETSPSIMLGVPRFFEKLYARIQEALQKAPPSKRRMLEWARRAGKAVADAHQAGTPVPFGTALQWSLAQALVLKKLRARLGGRLRFFVSGSAPLSRDIAEFFYTIGVPILEGYGLTETSPVIAVNRLPVPRFGSVGPLLPGVEVKIAEDGEILSRGPHIMQGYYRKPEATAAMIVDGWLHTGDIGHLDAAGFLYITDRKKDLIKTAGGKFVAPQRLENLFVTDPMISQAFVFGDRHPYCVALIVPNLERLRRHAQEQEIGAASAAELVRDPRIVQFYWERIAARQAHLPSFEQIKKIALLDTEFSQAAGELTPTLKAKRSIIAQKYGPVLDRLYAAEAR